MWRSPFRDLLQTTGWQAITPSQICLGYGTLTTKRNDGGRLATISSREGNQSTRSYCSSLSNNRRRWQSLRLPTCRDHQLPCTRKQAMSLNDVCGAQCPDLPKVLRRSPSCLLFGVTRKTYAPDE